jgi:hypothetical protein
MVLTGIKGVSGSKGQLALLRGSAQTSQVQYF